MAKKNNFNKFLILIIFLGLFGVIIYGVSQSVIFQGSELTCSAAKVVDCSITGNAGSSGVNGDIYLNIGEPSRVDDYMNFIKTVMIYNSNSADNFWSTHQITGRTSSKYEVTPNDFNSLPYDWALNPSTAFIGDHQTYMTVNPFEMWRVIMKDSLLTADAKVYNSREDLQANNLLTEIKVYGLCQLADRTCKIDDPYPNEEKWIVLSNINIPSREGGYTSDFPISTPSEDEIPSPTPSENQDNSESQTQNNQNIKTKTSWIYVIPVIFAVLFIILIYSIIKKSIKRRKS